MNVISIGETGSEQRRGRFVTFPDCFQESVPRQLQARFGRQDDMLGHNNSNRSSSPSSDDGSQIIYNPDDDGQDSDRDPIADDEPGTATARSNSDEAENENF